MATNLGVGIEFIGDWVGTKLSLERLPRDVSAGLKIANRKMAEDLYGRILQHVLSQDLPWLPLDPDYKERKLRRFGSSDIWVRSSKVLDSIKVYTEGYNASVGIKAGLNHPFSELKVYEVASINETGSSTRPARPLFIPSYKEYGGDDAIRKKIASALNKYLRSKGHKTIKLR